MSLLLTIAGAVLIFFMTVDLILDWTEFIIMKKKQNKPMEKREKQIPCQGTTETLIEVYVEQPNNNEDENTNN